MACWGFSGYTSAIMQPYDIAMVLVLAAATLFGVYKGMAWQVASLASVVVSTLVAVHSSAAVAPYFPGAEPWNRFLAMLLLYILTSAAIWIVFRLVSNIIDRVKLQEFDRQLGATFGLAKGVLYCVVITFFAVTLSESARKLVLESHSGELIARGIRNANPILPEDIRTYLGKYIDELDQKLNTPIQGEAGEKKPESAVPAPAKGSEGGASKEASKSSGSPGKSESGAAMKKIGEMLRGGK